MWSCCNTNLSLFIRKLRLMDKKEAHCSGFFKKKSCYKYITESRGIVHALSSLSSAVT